MFPRNPPRETERQARIVAICATGPSFNEDLAGLVQDVFRPEYGGRIMAVSDAYNLLPKADAMTASDLRWWKHHRPIFGGRKFCAQQPGTELLNGVMPVDQMPGYVNSGALALEVAARLWRPERIYLLGFDCHNRDGDHYFGPHPQGLITTKPERFEKIRREIQQQAVHVRALGCAVYCATAGSDLLKPVSGLPPICYAGSIDTAATSMGLE